MHKRWLAIILLVFTIFTVSGCVSSRSGRYGRYGYGGYGDRGVYRQATGTIDGSGNSGGARNGGANSGVGQNGDASNGDRKDPSGGDTGIGISDHSVGRSANGAVYGSKANIAMQPAAQASQYESDRPQRCLIVGCFFGLVYDAMMRAQGRAA